MDVLDSAADPFVRNPSNAIDADHYTPMLAVLNQRDETVRSYWLARWKEAHDDLGIGGIMMDSSFNLSLDKFHYVQNSEAGQQMVTADQVGFHGRQRPINEPPQAILSQHRAHLELLVAMQRLGYRCCAEDIGVFGVGRHGPAVASRLDNLFMWVDCIANFDARAIKAGGGDAADVFFRGLAFRLMWQLQWDPQRDLLRFRGADEPHADDVPSGWHIALLKAYRSVSELMMVRTVLPEEAGVVYASGDRQVLWAFTGQVVPLPGPRQVQDVLAGTSAECTALDARARHVYVIG